MDLLEVLGQLVLQDQMEHQETLDRQAVLEVQEQLVSLV
jgi:hypothetical protein